MQLVINLSKCAKIEGYSWETTIYDFPRNYRATTHSATNVSPVKIIFNRKIYATIPIISNDTDLDIKAKIISSQNIRNIEKKERYDKKTKDYSFSVGYCIPLSF